MFTLKQILLRPMNTSFFNKILITNIILTLLPLTLVIIFTYSKVSSISELEFSRYSLETVRQINRNISVFLNEMDLLVYAVSTNEQVQKALSYEQTGFEVEKVQTDLQVYNFLNNLFSSRLQNTSILIYGFNKELLYKGSSGINYDYDFENTKYRTMLNSAKQPKIYLSTFNRNYILDNKMVFSLLRRINSLDIRSSDNHQPIGYILLDLDYEIFSKLISNNSFSSNDDIIILDNDRIIFSKHTDMVSDKAETSLLKAVTNKNEGSQFLSIDNAQYFLTFSTITETGWKIISLHSISSFRAKTQSILNFLVIISLLSLLLAIFIAVFISSAITSPLKRLASLMKKVEEGNFDINFHSKYKDEVANLGNVFNLMVAKIKNLITTVYKSQLVEKDAVIFALQSQINPHFLYNTLQTISDVAENGDTADITSICHSLSSIFRYSIEGKSKFVRLYDEIEHIKNYIYIQSIRFNNRFKVVIDVPEELLGTNLPRLTIQPIVENSLYHGIFSKMDNAEISITAFKSGSNVCITVSDNGTGIESSKLEELQLFMDSNINNDNFDPKFIGLNNINKRMVLNYGYDYRIRIESSINQGTGVTVTVPV